MPYINKGSRRAIEPELQNLSNLSDKFTPGILNYIISSLVKSYLGTNPNYDRFNTAVGVLESAKLELYRHRIGPYEDTKIMENGEL